ncbi:MAG TPA: hypothetical protein VNH22_16275 [Blastocatellia bacterium]|jgi:hypothetical protein|nr:hypothetical protein [Blastocatellia bacterium]
MFEQPAGKVEKDRSRSIMIVSAIAVVSVIGLIVLVGALGLGRREPVKIQMSGPGSPEYDAYAPSLALTDFEKWEGERVNSRYGRLTALLRNTGDKTLAGLQVRGTAIGLNGEVLRQRTVNLIPGVRNSLDPNGVVEIDLYIEPIPDPSQVKDMTLEVSGLKLK